MMIYFLHGIVFLSAFLLFHIELIIAKMLLPLFGGSYLVWASCVFFFQTILLAGYAYAYSVSQKIHRQQRLWIHIILMSGPLFLFPLRLPELFENSEGLSLPVKIIFLLFLSIGPSFFILSSASVWIQNWFGQISLDKSKPYSLYATSNLGSFAAILGFPFLIEPRWTLNAQLHAWQIIYGLLCILYIPLLFFKYGTSVRTAVERIDEKRPVQWKDRIQWLLLSGSACALFLSVTNVISLDIAAVPLLWILPLGIYLITFVLCFRESPWYPKWLESRFVLAVIVGVYLSVLLIQSYKIPVFFGLFLHLSTLFILCMGCHHTLYQRRPERIEHLSQFYLFIALGGFLGSLLISWIIPIISVTLVEYSLSIFLVVFAISMHGKSARISVWNMVGFILILIILIGWPALLDLLHVQKGTHLAIFSGLFLAVILYLMKDHLRKIAFGIAIVVFASFMLHHFGFSYATQKVHRNYYGIYHIFDRDGKRYLKHGTTLHGSQYLDPARQKEALSYYHRTTPVGEFLTRLNHTNPIAIIGLGAGSLAVYGKEGQVIDFYELDADVARFAKKYFTFLDQSPAANKIIIGDARQSLKRQEMKYSIVIVDAFNSDAIPVHLITMEAILDYQKRLTDDAQLLFHISNKYLDLRPVLYANARQLNWIAYYKNNVFQRHPDAEACEWMALVRNEGQAEEFVRNGWQDCSKLKLKSLKPWTDQYSNIIRVIQR